LSTGSLKRLVQEYAQSSVIARTQLPVRLLFCGFAAAVIAVLTGNWPLAALWYGAVSGTLLLSSRIHDLAAERELPRWAPHWAPLAATGLVALVYVAVTPWVWMRGGHLGPVCVLLMLTGGSLNVLVLQHRQFRTVAAGLGPYAVFLLLTPIWAFLSEGPAVAFAVFLGVLAFLGNGLMLWRVWSQTVASEARSRAELETRRREAEAAVTAKSAFAAAVTHELRTPLSGVLAAAAELQRGAEDPRQEECAAIVAESARFMQSLLGDLLDLAKMDAGRMEVEATSFDLLVAGGAPTRSSVPDGCGPGLAGPGAGRSHPPAPDPQQPDLQRLEVHGGAGRALVARRVRAAVPALGCDDQGPGFRARHLARAAGAAFHTLRPDGLVGGADPRRDGPGPGDQPRTRPLDGR
jgi:hypothetical protein